MTASMPLIVPVLATVLVVAVLGFAIAMLLSWRSHVRQTEETGRAVLCGVQTLLGDHQRQVRTMLDAYEQQRTADSREISENMGTIQSDIEWLAGEKMIEQALRLVQENMPLSQISEETGLPQDTVRTLATFRPH